MISSHLFLTEDDLKVDSIYYQSIIDEYDTLLYDYLELLILFGYVMLFSVAAPLTPLIVFLLFYIERFVDSYKFFYLQRVTIISQSKGIEYYKYILVIFFCIGIITNLSLVLFNNTNDSPTLFKFFICFISENSLIISISLINYDIFPICKLN